MRVVGGRRPADQEEVGVEFRALDLGEEFCLGLCRQIDLDADARQHGDDRGADLLVRHVTVVRAIHAKLEAVGVAGLRQKLLGLRHVGLRPHVDLRIIPVYPRPIHQEARMCEAEHHLLRDHRLIDCQRESLSHAEILQRVLALDVGRDQLVAPNVETEIDRAQLRMFDQLQIRRDADPLHVLRRHGIDHVLLAGQQCRNARRGRTDHIELHAIGVARDLVPPPRVLLDHCLPVGLARDQFVRPGAHRIVHRVIVIGTADHHGLGRVMRLAPGLAHDQEVGLLLQKDRIRMEGLEIHRQIVDFPRLLHHRHRRPHVRGLGHDALE